MNVSSLIMIKLRTNYSLGTQLLKNWLNVSKNFWTQKGANSLFSFLAMFACSITCISQPVWINFSSSYPLKPTIRLLESSNQTVRCQVSISGMYSEEIKHDGEIFQRLSIPGGNKLGKQGWPELPSISSPIAIPDCGGITFSITVNDSLIFNNYYVYPSPNIVLDSSEGFLKNIEIFYKNDSAYSINEFMPGVKLESEKTAYMRNQKVMNMLYYPVRYNPVNKQLTVYTSAEISIGFQNPSSDVNINNGLFSRISKNNLLNYTLPQMPAMAPGPALNAGSVSWITLSDTAEAKDIVADYLIITDDNFFHPTHSQSLQRLAEHRSQFNGFDVAIVSVQNILNLQPHFTYYPAPPLTSYWDYARQVRKFTMRVFDGKHAAHTYDNRVAFLCLVGHAYGDSASPGMLTSFDPNPTGGPGLNDTIYSMSANDYYFTCVTRDNGNWDPIGDLFVGRLSAVTETDLQNIVEKTIHNETEYQIDPWKTKTTLAYGGAYVPGNPTLIHDYFCISLPAWLNSLNSNYTTTVIDHENSGVNWNSDYINYINSNSSNIVFHYGHGTGNSWCAQSECNNVNQGSITFAYKQEHLNNINKYPFAMSQSCNTGSYTNVNGLGGMGELITTYSFNKGYVAYLGSYTPIPLPMNQTGTFPVTLHERILQAIFQGNSHILGEAILEARLGVLYNNFDVVHFQNNLFGDPALNLMAPGYLITTNTTIPPPFPAPSITTISTKVTVMPGVTLTLLSANTLRFVENGQLIIKEGAVLELGSNVTIQGQEENNRILVEGTVRGTSGADILNLNMSALSGTRWGGIEFSNPQLEVTLHSCNISNCNLNGMLKKLTLDDNSVSQYPPTFANSSVSLVDVDFNLNKGTFTNSNIHLSNNKRISNIAAKINFSAFANCESNGVIEIDHYRSGEIENNSIHYETGTGICLFYCGDNANEVKIKNCTIQKTGNSTESTWGVRIYRSLAELYRNTITNNTYGVSCIDYSHISLKGEVTATSTDETQQIRNNTNNQVRAFDNSFPYYFHYNKIDYAYPLTNPVNPLIYCDNFAVSSDPSGNPLPNVFSGLFNIKCNCFPANPVFFPSAQHVYSPSWCPPFSTQCSFQSAAEDAFQSAILEMDSAHYSDAEIGFKQIIREHPNDVYSIESAKKLISLKLLSDRDFQGLKIFYDTSYNLHIDTLTAIMTERLKNQCDIESMNYQEAIDWFESRILTPPTFNDSIYAILDLEDLYMIMSADSTQRPIHEISAKLPEYKIQNTIQFLAEREKHVRMLFREIDSLNYQKNFDDKALKILNIHPNPVKNVAELSYQIPRKGKVVISVHDQFGQTAVIYDLCEQDEGVHQQKIDLEQLSDGFYIVSLKFNGIQKSQVKVIKNR